MNRAVPVACGLLLAAPCGAGAAEPVPFASVMAAYLADYTRQYPVAADALGIQTYADRIEDVSAAGHDAEVAWRQAWRARIAATASPSDGPDVRADRRSILDTIDAQQVEDELLAPWRTDPQVYVSLLGQSVFV